MYVLAIWNSHSGSTNFFPHWNTLDLEDTLTEYKDFLFGLGSSLAVSDGEDGVSLDCMNSYKIAIAKRDALEDFESAVSVS